jgi:hypothetical protein
MHFVLSQVSEGLDFADRAGRAVIVTGMPFSTPTDPKVLIPIHISFLRVLPSLSPSVVRSFFFQRVVRGGYK